MALHSREVEPTRVLEQPPFLPSGPAASMHIRTVQQGPAPTASRTQGHYLVVRETKTTATRRVAATKTAIIDSQLKVGAIEVNIACLARDDVDAFVRKLRHAGRHVQVLRLKSIPRRSPHSAYDKDELNDPSMANRPVPYMAEEHKHGVCIASAHMQHKTIRYRLYATLESILLKSHITELEIGMRLSKSGYAALSTGLAGCTTLRRLSFAGSHMGDAPLTVLQSGLESNISLEELDLTACDVGDMGLASLAAVIKGQARRRSEAMFRSGLRQYPDLSTQPHMAHMQHYLTMRSLVTEVDQQCGGWLLLELALNPRITDRGALGLRDALCFDRRLVMLSLRATGLSAASEAEFVALMREHLALARVDLRQCTGTGAKKMGILKLQKGGMAPRINALGLVNTGRVGVASPTLTHKSMAFCELMEGDAAAGGGRMLGLGVGGLGASPWASPSPSGRARASLSSHLSWGDQQLNSMRSRSTLSSPSSPTRLSRRSSAVNSPSAHQRGGGRPAAASGQTGGAAALQGHPEGHEEDEEDTLPQRCSSPMGAAHAAVGQGAAVFQDSETRSTPARRLKKKRRRAPAAARSQPRHSTSPGPAGGPPHDAVSGGVQGGASPAPGVRPLRADAGQAVAEVAGLLRQLELEVSKAEYQAALAREDRASLGLQRMTALQHSVQQPAARRLGFPTQATAAAAAAQQASPVGLQGAEGQAGAENRGFVAMLKALGPSVEALGLQLPHSDLTQPGTAAAAAAAAPPSAAASQQRLLQLQLRKWCDMCDEVLEEAENM